MLNFKLALKEIFEVEMETGGKLYNLCDGVLASGVMPLPDTYNKFIMLGQYNISDVIVGELQQKFRVLELEIDCGAIVRAGIKDKDAEENAEEVAYVMASAVRTILVLNKTLVSTSFTNGLAKMSEPLDEGLHYDSYDGSVVAFNTITYVAKIVEAN